MSSPFSTFTEKKIEKSSRKKLSKKNRKNNIQEFFKWSAISFVATFGYIIIAANFKGLSYLDDKYWVSTDEDYKENISIEKEIITTQEDVDNVKYKKKKTLPSLAKYLAFHSGFQPYNESYIVNTSFARPNSDDTTLPLIDKYYLTDKDFSNYSPGDFGPQLFRWLTGSTLAYPAKDVLNQLPDDSETEKADIFNGSLDSFASAGNFYSLFHNQSLFITQYIRSNNLLKKMIQNQTKEDKNYQTGGQQQGNESNGVFKNSIKAISGIMNTISDKFSELLGDDIAFVLWPFIFVLVILHSLLLPLINVGNSMYDLFMNPYPTSGVGFNGFKRYLGTDDKPLGSSFMAFNEKLAPYEIMKSTDLGTFFKNKGLQFLYFLVNLIWIPLVFAVAIVISILCNIRNFIFAVIDTIEKILFMSPVFFTWTSKTKDSDAINETSEFLKNKAPIAFGIWVLFLIIFAFTYLGNEFATGGILGLAAICIYFLDKNMQIFTTIINFVFGSEDDKQKEDTQANGIFERIFELLKKKPILSTIMISLIAGIVAASVVAGIYLS